MARTSPQYLVLNRSSAFKPWCTNVSKKYWLKHKECRMERIVASHLSRLPFGSYRQWSHSRCCRRSPKALPQQRCYFDML